MTTAEDRQDRTAPEWRATAAPSLRHAWLVIRPLLIIVAFLQLAPPLWLIGERSLAVPYGDEWATVGLVQRATTGALRPFHFWRFHNEHRIPVPRAISLALVALTSYDRQAAMVFNLAVVICTALLLLALARRGLGTQEATLPLVVPLSLLLFSPAQFENWLSPFQIAFIATVFGVALCAWALTARTLDQRRFGLALGGAIVASLSSFGGLMAWLAFGPLVVARAGWRRALVWCGVALAVIVPYLWGFPRLPSGSRDPLLIAGYGLAYLGAPLGYPDTARAQVAALAGLAVLLLNLPALWVLRRSGVGGGSGLGGWFGLGAFVLACAALTSLGRGPSNGIAQAIAPRYQAFSALWWVVLVVLAWTNMLRLAGWLRSSGATAGVRPPRTAAWWGLAGLNVLVLLLLCAGAIGANRAGFRAGAAWLTLQRENQGCIVDYQRASDSCLALFFPEPQLVREQAPMLERLRLGPFRDPAAVAASQRAPGVDPAQLAKRGGPTPAFIETVSGVIVTAPRQEPLVIPAGASVTVTGWAVDGPAQAAAGGVFVTVDGARHFAAVYGGDRPDVAEALRNEAFRHSAFTASIPIGALPPGRYTLTLTVVTNDRRAYYEPAPRARIEIR